MEDYIKKLEIKTLRGKCENEFSIENRLYHPKKFFNTFNLKKLREDEENKIKEDLKFKKLGERKANINNGYKEKAYNQKVDISAFDLKTNQIIRGLYIKLLQNNNKFMFSPKILELIQFRERMKEISKFLEFTFFPKDDLIKIEIVKLDNQIIDYFNLFKYLY